MGRQWLFSYNVQMPSSVQLVVSETKMYTFTVRFYPTTHLQNFEAKKCHGIIFVKWTVETMYVIDFFLWVEKVSYLNMVVSNVVTILSYWASLKEPFPLNCRKTHTHRHAFSSVIQNKDISCNHFSKPICLRLRIWQLFTFNVHTTPSV